MILGIVAYTVVYVYGKERIMREGELVLLTLEPVDPRSLLQGDYMDLRYAIGRAAGADTLPPRGYLIFRLTADSIGHFARIQGHPSPLSPSERLIRFRRRRTGALRNGSLHIGSESYFFQEGRAERFAAARYGGLRIDGQGDAVLVGLYDERRRRIPD